MYIYIGSFIVMMALILYILRPKIETTVQTKEEKRKEILDGYKKHLREALEALKDDQDTKIAKKSALLKKFSDELASNIFFDNNEIYEIILGLSNED